ncbi:putative disease resistance RPP13-like protein 1 isoform X2 [Panicum virgatum]|uniref:putative disease resistance RPP13-like protein 1 isoform X2 n=1 Tax=Panicum virgatum TaxID=38727 RepID=UPI0019D59A09|nr:putative disease resistance RPP13-like protein 1 isoform X2 [Panicum virgatum]
MVGPGLTVGGWFAGAVISNFVAKARSILEANHALQAEAGDMLYSVQAALPRIRILVEVTERKAISNGSYDEWLQQFKDVVYEAEDLLDDFETKRIQDELRRKSSKVGSAASFALSFHC